AVGGGDIVNSGYINNSGTFHNYGYINNENSGVLTGSGHFYGDYTISAGAFLASTGAKIYNSLALSGDGAYRANNNGLTTVTAYGLIEFQDGVTYNGLSRLDLGDINGLRLGN
ncbi:MAG: hypothetical protein ACK559_13545, partial [bacterium]